jgi:hypothetical protein
LKLPIADLRRPSTALSTFAATGGKGHCHPIAGPPFGNGPTNFNDLAGKFVAGHVWQRRDVRIVPLPAMPVAAANARSTDGDHDALVRWTRIINAFDAKRAAEFIKQRCMHGEVSVAAPLI